MHQLIQLKTAFIYRAPVKADFNGDHKTDYGVILENKKTKELELYVIYSDKDAYTKQDLGALSDKLDLVVHKSKTNEPFYGMKKPTAYDGLAVECNGYNELFIFDPKLNKLKSGYRQDVGP